MEPFDKELPQVIARAVESGVNTIITVGTGLTSSQKAVQLAEDHPELLAAVGFHPHGADRVQEEDVARVAEIARHPRVVAIGEMGLDFYRNLSPRPAQLRVLSWQLELADKLKLPVIIHCREAKKDMLSLLGNWRAHHKGPGQYPIGVIHCFQGNSDTAQKYLDMGFFLSLGAYISYPASRQRYNVIRAIPEDRLLVETDSPFLPPQSHRGRRNEPAYLPLTVELLAEIRGVSPASIAKATTRNARRLFRFKETNETDE